MDNDKLGKWKNALWEIDKLPDISLIDIQEDIMKFSRSIDDARDEWVLDCLKDAGIIVDMENIQKIPGCILRFRDWKYCELEYRGRDLGTFMVIEEGPNFYCMGSIGLSQAYGYPRGKNQDKL